MRRRIRRVWVTRGKLAHVCSVACFVSHGSNLLFSRTLIHNVKSGRSIELYTIWRSSTSHIEGPVVPACLSKTLKGFAQYGTVQSHPCAHDLSSVRTSNLRLYLQRYSHFISLATCNTHSMNILQSSCSEESASSQFHPPSFLMNVHERAHVR